MKTLRLAVFAMVIGVFVACADTDGSDPYASWKSVSHRDDAYVLRYLSPPFKQIDQSKDGQWWLSAIEAKTELDVSPERGRINVDARLELLVEVVDLPGKDDLDVLIAADRDHFESEADVGDEAGYTSGNGVEGVTYRADFETHFVVFVYYAVEDFVVVVSLSSPEQSLVEGPDAALLLRGVEPLTEEE